jgi:hypothetical protein
MLDERRRSLRVRVAPRLVAAVLALSVLGLAAPATAESVRITSNTGLFTVNAGHSAALTLVETGGTAAEASAVTLELLDGADRLLARRSGTLLPGQPIRLALPAVSTGVRLVRARARLTTAEDNLASAAILTFEVFNPQSLDSFVAQTCRMEYDPEGTGGRVLGDCGGCSTSVEPLL